jgi:hypothetical protein
LERDIQKFSEQTKQKYIHDTSETFLGTEIEVYIARRLATQNPFPSQFSIC